MLWPTTRRAGNCVRGDIGNKCILLRFLGLFDVEILVGWQTELAWEKAQKR